jgi:hypothetical protein
MPMLDCGWSLPAMATRVTLTYVDYAAIPSDGRRYEVHEGELAVTHLRRVQSTSSLAATFSSCCMPT